MLNPFQQRVKDRLAELGINAFEAARRGKFERNFVNDIIDGTKRSVRGENMDRLAAALSWSVPELLGQSATSSDSATPAVNGPADPDPPSDVRAAPPVLYPHPDRIPGNRDVPQWGIAYASEGEDWDFSINEGDVIDYRPRPPGLRHRRDAFVIETVNDSMVPRFRPGDPLFIDPHTKARPGDDVVVELHPLSEGGPRPAFVKCLVARTATQLVLEQYNPPRELRFDMKRVKAVWRIVPLRELLVGA